MEAGLVAVLGVVAIFAAVGRRSAAVRQRSRIRARVGVPAGSPDRAAGAGPSRWVRVVVARVDRPVTVAGRWLRQSLRRPRDGAADRRWGWAVLAGIATALVGGAMVGAVAVIVILGGPVVRGHLARRRRAGAVLAEVPDVVDLLRLAVESGLEVGPALATVAVHVDRGEVAAVLDRIGRRVARGDRLVDALVELEDLGEPARPLREALVASSRHGVPLVPALERVGGEARDVRRRHREEQARSLPVKLLFPLVFCTLPALVVLTVVPLLARSFPSLAP